MALLCLMIAACNLSDPVGDGELDEQDAPGPDTTERDTTERDAADVSPELDGTSTDGDADVGDGDCLPTEESCNGVDDDCDGVIDEECPCDYQDTSTGVCAQGVIDTSGTCTEPDDYISSDDESPDHCDGLDNDCDGVTDEGCPCNFQDNPEGVCSGQTRQSDGTCPTPEEFQSNETACGDDLDNDCDGATDFEDPDCKNAAGEICSADEECRSTCVSVSDTEQRCAYRAFVSSTNRKGGFGGISTADSLCNQLANSAGLVGTWKAIISDASTNARDRFSLEAPLVDVQGNKIADSKSDLFDSSIDNPIEFDENASTTSGDVWTGSDTSGNLSSGENCENWSTNAAVNSAQVGNSTQTDRDWIRANSVGCNESHHFYCVEQ